LGFQLLNRLGVVSLVEADEEEDDDESLGSDDDETDRVGVEADNKSLDLGGEAIMKNNKEKRKESTNCKIEDSNNRHDLTNNQQSLDRDMLMERMGIEVKEDDESVLKLSVLGLCDLCLELNASKNRWNDDWNRMRLVMHKMKLKDDSVGNMRFKLKE
jgi:hypothetical protein